ncbi:6-hydroxymethylpterin diphosphokinase MptE-like protein [Foetidibacter luteolus]|uniref:6-hydroxymethylpterin diphosphokinase MptE-like protein n=1 Tax=Foetidibacter luteolus TaxID=2608880 RepID=UPI00129B3371|nr:6-hydroxymethylpterin diphosphokinase MptE-like protein [Foetidibacter luteolus]
MNRYIHKLSEAFKKEGPAGAFKKIMRNVSIRSKRKLTINKRSLENWADLKGKFKGKRAFLIGNGPSLNKTPLYLLEDEYCICFNRFNVMFERLGWVPKFYMCADALVAKDMAGEINEIASQVELAFFPDIHTSGLDFRTFIDDRENIQWMFPEFKGFYFDLPKVGLGGSVAYPALQVLTFLGFSEIYLIGVDMNYQVVKSVKEIKGTDVASQKDDDPNHFDPRYFGTNRKYHQPVKAVVDNIMSSFDYAAVKIAENTPTKVYNAGIGSKVECFEKVDFNSLFSNVTEEEKFRLFGKPFSKAVTFNNYDDMVAKATLVNAKDEISEGMPYFLAPVELGGALIKDLIFKYIPFGPYKDNMLFVSRTLLEK